MRSTIGHREQRLDDDGSRNGVCQVAPSPAAVEDRRSFWRDVAAFGAAAVRGRVSDRRSPIGQLMRGRIRLDDYARDDVANDTRLAILA